MRNSIKTVSTDLSTVRNELDTYRATSNACTGLSVNLLGHKLSGAIAETATMAALPERDTGSAAYNYNGRSALAVDVFGERDNMSSR